MEAATSARAWAEVLTALRDESLALSTSYLLATKTGFSEARKLLEDKVRLRLVNSPRFDLAGRVWNGHASIRRYKDSRSLKGILAFALQVPLVLDEVNKNHDEKYLDTKTLRQILTGHGT